MAERDPNAPVFETTFAPARWPSPDWGQGAYVSVAWLPDDITVGRLIRQGDALLFLSLPSDDDATDGARLLIRDVLQDALDEGITSRDAWDRAQAAALFRPTEWVELPELAATVRREWES